MYSLKHELKGRKNCRALALKMLAELKIKNRDKMKTGQNIK